MEKRFPSTQLHADMLERWPHVCRIKVTLTLILHSAKRITITLSKVGMAALDYGSTGDHF